MKKVRDPSAEWSNLLGKSDKAKRDKKVDILPAKVDAAAMTMEDHLLTDVLDWAAKDSHLTREQYAKLRESMKENAARFEVAIVMLARRRLHRLGSIMDRMDELQDELASPARLQNSRTEDIAQVLDSLTRYMESTMKLLADVRDRGIPAFVLESPTVEAALSDAVSSAKPTQREDLRSLLQRVHSSLKRAKPKD